MKKLLPYLLLFILAGGGISCSDDDPTVPEPEAVMPPAPVASDITSEAEAAAAPVTASYTVKSGENRANIGRHFYGNLDKRDEICELNSSSDPNRLAAGQKIILPK